MSEKFKVIAFDADDTLWDCQSHFEEVEEHPKAFLQFAQQLLCSFRTIVFIVFLIFIFKICFPHSILF